MDNMLGFDLDLQKKKSFCYLVRQRLPCGFKFFPLNDLKICLYLVMLSAYI